jgi:hypothetical protein
VSSPCAFAGSVLSFSCLVAESSEAFGTLTCFVVSLVWACRGRSQKCGEMADVLLTLGADMLIDGRLWMDGTGGRVESDRTGIYIRSSTGQ